MKKSQLDRAIEALDQEIAMLQMAQQKLLAQKTKTKAPIRRPRIVEQTKGA